MTHAVPTTPTDAVATLSLHPRQRDAGPSLSPHLRRPTDPPRRWWRHALAIPPRPRHPTARVWRRRRRTGRHEVACRGQRRHDSSRAHARTHTCRCRSRSGSGRSRNRRRTGRGRYRLHCACAHGRGRDGVGGYLARVSAREHLPLDRLLLVPVVLHQVKVLVKLVTFAACAAGRRELVGRRGRRGRRCAATGWSGCGRAVVALAAAAAVSGAGGVGHAWAAAHPAATYVSRRKAAPCWARRPDAVVGCAESAPVREVGAHFCESWEVPSGAILRRIPALHQHRRPAGARAPRPEQTRYGQQGGIRTAFQARLEGVVLKLK